MAASPSAVREGSDSIGVLSPDGRSIAVADRGMTGPGFVRDEIEAFATCGDFEHGFSVAHYRRCGRQPAGPVRLQEPGHLPLMHRLSGASSASLASRRVHIAS